MKKLQLIICILIGLLVITSCDNNTQKHYVDKPSDTNLEFWITEDADKIDYSKYYVEYNKSYGSEFYGSGYEPFLNNSGVMEKPLTYVKYKTSKFPNTSSNNLAVTEIEITDPNITFYGISLNTSFDDFDNILKDLGYLIVASDEYMHTAVKNNVRISISKKYLVVYAVATNDSFIYW